MQPLLIIVVSVASNLCTDMWVYDMSSFFIADGIICVSWFTFEGWRLGSSQHNVGKPYWLKAILQRIQRDH